MANLTKRRPELMTPEVFGEMFAFYWHYLKHVMLLPGHVEQWVSICDLHHMGATALPRKVIMAFGNLAQNNLMYFLFRSFYLQVSWGQRMLYNAISYFVDPETREKIVLDGTNAPAAMSQLFHPS